LLGQQLVVKRKIPAIFFISALHKALVICSPPFRLRLWMEQGLSQGACQFCEFNKRLKNNELEQVKGGRFAGIAWMQAGMRG